MKGLAVMLKALGISISPEHIQAVQELLPVLPQKLNQAWEIVHSQIVQFDARLAALEAQNKQIIELLEVQNGKRRTGDTGNTTDPGPGN